MDSQLLLSCALDVGEQMLISGAEVYRVEDCIKRICTAYGCKRVDVFTITSSIVVTLVDANHERATQTRRIASTNTDLTKLEKLNAMSRWMCSETPDLSEVKSRFRALRDEPKYHFLIECGAYAVIAGAFTVFFGGSYGDGLVSLFIGLCLRFIVYAALRCKLNAIFANFVSSFAMSFLAFAAVGLGLGQSVDNIVIGNIMLLIPGVALTNSLRDMISGDTMAGALRLLEALLIAIALAAGFILCAVLAGGLGL